jgi:hypothetical protein
MIYVGHWHLAVGCNVEALDVMWAVALAIASARRLQVYLVLPKVLDWPLAVAAPTSP